MTQESKVHCAGDIYFHVPQSTSERPIDTLFLSNPKADQYWRRQNDFPKFFYDYNPHLPEKKLCRLNATQTHYVGDKLVSLSVEDTLELRRLVAREVRRMKNGVFIMNNGVKIYFPGYYYGTLQWAKMIGVNTNNGYGQHRRYQREFACQRLKVIEDDELSGYYVHKIKKCGITQLLNCFFAIESITNRQFTIAQMSKNHDTAKSANFIYYAYVLKNLPHVLIPSIDQKSWAGAVQKIQIRCNDREFSLENVCAAVPSTTDGIDGLPPLNRVCLSEMPKMDYAEAILTKTIEQLRIQKTKIGIIEMESYPPEDDIKSFKYCRELYTKGCQAVDEKGYPKNKILPLYIGLLEATNGTHDIYGDPDKLLALQMEQKERDNCDTQAKLQARTRQYHLTPKEGWAVGGGGSVYNNIALTEQQTLLEEQYNFGQLNYMAGNLEWTAGFLSPVRFVPLSHEDIMAGKVGKWKFYCTMEYLEKNTNLCFKMQRKKKLINKEIIELLQPPDDVFHVSGTDPVDYAYIAEMGTKQSKNASITRKLTGELLSVYWHRGEDPDESLEDFAMEMIFLGLYAIIEGNRKNAVTTLEKLGMYYFMLIRHPNGEIKPYTQAAKIKHVSSGKDLKSEYISLIIKHIKNSIHFFGDVDIISQHKEFDPDKTQKSDLSVADGLSFVAVDKMQSWIISKKSVSDQYAHLGKLVQRMG